MTTASGHRPDDDLEALTALTAADQVPFEETDQGQRELDAKPGFTGMLHDYLDWIEEMLMFGSLTLSEPQPHEWRKGLFRELRLVTAGFSADERLIGRVERSLLGLRYWESSHRGGLFVFRIPQQALDSDHVHEWMEPETDVFETIHLVDRIHTPHGSCSVDPGLEKVELSCRQHVDTTGNIRRTLTVMPKAFDDETRRLFNKLRDIEG